MNKKREICYKFSKIPMLKFKEPVLMDISEDLEKLTSVKKSKQKKVLECIFNSSKVARIKTAKNIPLKYCDEIPPEPISVDEFRKFSKTSEIEMSRFQEKSIRRRIAARGLEEKYSQCVNNFIKEVKLEYVKTVHHAGMNNKIKLCHPEGKSSVAPYKFIGKTKNYNNFLATRELFERKYLLHFPIIRKIQHQCVSIVPTELFKLNINEVKSSKDIVVEFKEQIEKADQWVYEIFRNLLDIIEKQINKTNLSDSRQYLKTLTGLINLHISKSVIGTIENIVDFTAAKDPKPYIILEVSFDGQPTLEPTPEELIEMYYHFIDELLEVRNEIYDIESMKIRGLRRRNVNLYITNDFLEKCKEQIKFNITKQFEPIIEYMEGINNNISHVYKDLISEDLLESTTDMDLEYGCKKLKYYRKYLNKVMLIPDYEFFRIAKVSLKHYKKVLHEALHKNINMVFGKLAHQHLWEVNDICNTFEHIRMRALKIPETTEELVDTGKYMSWVKHEYLETLNQRVSDSLSSLCQIIDLGLIIDEHINLNCMSIQWLTDILPVVEEYAGNFDTLKYEAEERLQKVVEDLGEMIKKVFPLLTLLDEMDDISNSREYLHYITLHMRKIKEIEIQIDIINREEVTLSFPKSTYSEYEELKNQIYPFYHLLNLCLKVQQNLFTWQDGPLEMLDYDSTKDAVNDFHKELSEINKTYRTKLRQAQDENLPLRFRGTVDDPDTLNWPAPLKLCGTALKQIEEFKPAVKVIKVICNNCLMQRHWQAMSEIAGMDITPDAGTTLRKIMKVDFFSRLEEYEIISTGAIKEQLLLDQLILLKQQWNEIEFTVEQHQQYEIRMLIHLDEIETVITDQTTIIFNMRGSVFVKPYEREVKEFYEILLKILQTITYWFKVQNILIKLYPLISLEDLNKIIPAETEMLKNVLDIYNSSIAFILKDMNVIKVVRVSTINNDIINCANILEIVLQGVQFYMDCVRKSFPRFYFISNEEFIKALSNPNQILLSEFFLNKLFQGIRSIYVKEDEIVGIISNNDEILKFVSPICKACNLETIFKRIDTEMKSTLKKEILQCSQNYDELEFRQIFSNYCEQTLKIISWYSWREKIEMALCINSSKNMKINLEKIEVAISEEIQFSKESLNNTNRCKLKNIIVSDIYTKDLIQQIINSKKITIDSFEWEAHFKYYLKNSCLKVNVMNSTIDYMYEYSGNYYYIITPNTERCLRMLTNAFIMNYCALVNSHSDSGKFECIQILSSIIGNFLLKFVCSEDLGTKTIETILKGTLLCGSWICFENFTNLKLSVMSAISGYLFNIQQAKRENYEQCTLGGVTLQFKKSCFINVCTTNGAYRDLPGGLKKFFRVITLLKPDTKKITEIILCSLRFKSPAGLARKISCAFEFLHDMLLNKQQFYCSFSTYIKVLQESERLQSKNDNVKEIDIIYSSLHHIINQEILKDNFQEFHCVLHHLFPDATLVGVKNKLNNEIRSICHEENLQWTREFSDKISEVYQCVRNNQTVILIGDTCSSKTTIYQICQKLFNSLDQKQLNLYFVPPSCFDARSLYGYLTDSSEWVDGIVTKLFRVNVESTTKLIVFDGDINPLWIENVKPIFKEKSLYLTSGEIVKLGDLNKVVFETDNLNNCSPSVISHSNVIHVDQNISGWKAMVKSWTATCKSEWLQGFETVVTDIFLWLISPCLSFIKEKCKQICYLSDTNLVKNMITLTKLLLDDASSKNKTSEDLKNMSSWIQATIIQAGVLGLAGLLDIPSKPKFDEFYRSLWRGQNSLHPYPKSFTKLEVSIPHDGLICDYHFFYKQRGSWKLYQDLLKAEKIIDSPYIENILVPTVDTMRYFHILSLYIRNHLSVLLVGPSCIGKTIILENLLRNNLDESNCAISHFNFNLYFTTEKTQHVILSKLNRRKGGIYSPPVDKRLVVFIDNLNLVTADYYGNFGTTELLRQYLDHGMWYDLNSFNEILISKVNIISAMSIIEGSKKNLGLRFLRHFHIFGSNQLSMETVTRIYSNMLLHIWRQQGFPSDVALVVNQITEATTTIFKKFKLELPPTLTRPHYYFNMNIFNDIIQGFSLLKKETYDGNKKIYIKLWIHEILTVFGDRLYSEDNRFLEQQIKTAINVHFPESPEDVLEFPLNKIIMSTLNEKNSENMKYEEIADSKCILDMLNQSLFNYNLSNKFKINITFFEYALQKIFKISRLLSIKPGNALCLGSSGVGRVVLSKLLSFIYGFKYFQPILFTNYQVEDWKCEIKKVLKETGALENKSVFLVNEKDIIDEEFLQYVEQLLQNGDVHDIFTSEEKQEILELSRLSAQGGNRNVDISSAAVFSHFNKCYKQNLHVILCLSSNARQLRQRLRNFPNIFNCHITFWDDWPDEALENVADIAITNLSLEPDDKSKCIDSFIYFHRQFRNITKHFVNDLPSKLNISPLSFLHLIELFKEIFFDEKIIIEEKIKKFSQGLAKLLYAANQILDMEKVLADYKPQLAEMTEKAIEMTNQIALETIEVEKASDLVRKDEKIASEQAAVAQNLKSECESELAQAIPILEDAISALNTLKPSDITLVKSMKNPPDAIKLVMAAVCVIKDVKPDKIPDPSTGRKTYDFWGPSKRILGDMNFLQTLKDFDKDDIKPEIMVKIRKDFLPHKDFKPHTVAKASSAAEGLCKWIIAMDMYDKVAKEVAPKKEKLGKAEKDYAQTMEILEQKKEEVKRIEEKLAALNALLEDANKKQLKLQREVDLCNKKLASAQKLIGSLGEEQIRWNEAVKSLEKQNELALGNVLLTAGIVVYLAPLNSNTRNGIIEEWRQYLSNHIRCSLHFSMALSFSSKLKIEVREQTNLLRDDFFLQNILIYDFSKKYSIFIDPDHQAYSWIIKSERWNSLTSTTFIHTHFFEELKKCIILGKPILIHKINDEIPYGIHQLLSKKIYVDDDNTIVFIHKEAVILNKDFRLYLVCNQEPKSLPDILNKLTVVDFTITQNYFSKRLLQIVTEYEKPELKKEKKYIYASKNKNQLDIAATEKYILKTLCESEVDILEDEDSIRILEENKIVLRKLRINFEDALLAEHTIDDFIKQYQSITNFVANIYVFICKLKHINYIYQFSYEWFIYIYYQSIGYAKKSKIIAERCKHIMASFTIDIYRKINYSLYQEDTFTVVFLLTVFILKYKGLVTNDDIQAFITSYSSDKFCNWDLLAQIENVSALYNFSLLFRLNYKLWHTYITTDSPIPEPWNSSLTKFQKLILIKLFKPKQLHDCMMGIVESILGRNFLDFDNLNFNNIYNESYCLSPLLFINKNDNEFLDELYILTKKKKVDCNFKSVYMSDSFTTSPECLLKEAQKNGYWLLINNCHLNVDWMEKLEKAFEKMDYENTDQNFRLWLTSEPSTNLPVSLLQRSTKIVFDYPGNFRKNMQRIFNKKYIADYFYNGCPGKKEYFSKLLFGLISFFSCLSERLHFDEIFWNVPYSLNENDIKVSTKLLQTFVNETKNFNVNFEKLLFILGNYIYSSSLSTSNTFLFIDSFLRDFVNPEIVKNKFYCFNNIREYSIPKKCDIPDYSKVILGFPSPDLTAVFSINENINNVRSIIETNKVVEKIQSIFAPGHKIPSIEDTQAFIMLKINEILSGLPNELERTDPLGYILGGEYKRYNMLLKTILNTLNDLKKLLNGFSQISLLQEEIANDIFNSIVPQKWKSFLFSYNESLPEFLKMLENKVHYLRNFHITQRKIWLPAFSLPKALLRKIKMDMAFQNNITLENFGFSFEVLNVGVDIDESNNHGGVIVSGLFIANAQWDKDSNCFCEMSLHMFNEFPLLLLKPNNIVNCEFNFFYKLPLYYSCDLVSWIINIYLKSIPNQRHWIKRDVKLICNVSNIVSKYETDLYNNKIKCLENHFNKSSS